MSPQNGGACCHDSANTGNVFELPATRNKSVSGDECLILAGAEETHHGAADVSELEALPRDLQAALLLIWPPSPPKNCNQIKSKVQLATDFLEISTLLCVHCSLLPVPAHKNFESGPILQRILHTRSESAPKYVGFLFQPHPTAAVETKQDFVKRFCEQTSKFLYLSVPWCVWGGAGSERQAQLASH